MARVTTKTAEVKYVLELSKREAEALTEMLIMVDEQQGEGPALGDIYAALCEAGCESRFTFHKKGVDGEVIVYREEAA